MYVHPMFGNIILEFGYFITETRIQVFIFMLLLPQIKPLGSDILRPTMESMRVCGTRLSCACPIV